MDSAKPPEGGFRPVSSQRSTALSSRVQRLRSDWILIGTDAAVVAAAYVAALALRYDADVPSYAWSGMGFFLPFAVAVVLSANALAGLYSGVWRHASVYEARRVLVAQTFAVAVVVPLVLLLGHRIPLSVPFIAGTLIVGLVGAVRFQSRLFSVHRRSSRDVPRVIVLGAGTTGADLARDIDHHPEQARVVAFLDDDPDLQRRRVQGVAVLGAPEELPAVAGRLGASHAVLAMPHAGADRVRRILAVAERSGIALRVVPPLSELANGRASLQDVRDIEISDLLERAPVESDLEDIRDLVKDRRVLVTGGGGSIGSEIARQVAALGAAKVVLLDHDETHLFDAAARLPGTAVQRLADIREPFALQRVFEADRPEVVFHAAAHKHVPLLEDHPVEAVQTNVFGTLALMQVAREAGVQQFVFISTDKAVEPRNVMGATKFVGERVALSYAGDMVVCAVRFGNVLGSRGSVVPTFANQIRSGGPVTVTDARMTRYFMSIPEAVRLVLHAAALTRGGEVFMLEMGEPVRIVDLAHRMIRMSGRRPGLDVEIRVTGARPGEKLAERLHTDDESCAPTSHPAIVRLSPRTMATPVLEQGLTALRAAVEVRDDDSTRNLLIGLVDSTRAGQIPKQSTQRQTLVEGGAVAWT